MRSPNHQVYYGEELEREFQNVRNVLDQLEEILKTSKIGGLRLTGTEIKIVHELFMNKRGPFNRADMKRLIDAGLVIPPKSSKNKVNGRIRVEISDQLQEQFDAIKVFLSI